MRFNQKDLTKFSDTNCTLYHQIKFIEKKQHSLYVIIFIFM